MLFTSISFLYYFLPIVLIAYFIVPKKAKNFVLFIASMAFYFYGEPKYIFLMLAEIFIAYVGAILIDKYKKKSILAVILAIHIGLLVFFKYTDFLIANINNIFGAKIDLLQLALPIGISFYTFQIISYEIDVFRGNVKVQRNFLNLATYVALFPQLIAGPIVRYETIEDELSNRKHSFENFAYGARRFVIGLAKKVLIANMLGEFCNKFSATDEKSVVLYWLFAISYMLQIYFDFSGYSDMAIGMGRMFGFNFLENFNYPYISKSVTEFWRRWHMSLSSFFRDYVYIPLGGNRKHQIFNIMVVWMLTGLWHGASWNFVLWGLFYGILLIIEKKAFKGVLLRLPSFFGHLYCIIIFVLGWALFYFTDFNDLKNWFICAFGGTGKLYDYTGFTALMSNLWLFIACAVASTPLLRYGYRWFADKCRAINIIVTPILVVVLLAACFVLLVGESYNPFLYFRF